MFLRKTRKFFLCHYPIQPRKIFFRNVMKLVSRASIMSSCIAHTSNNGVTFAEIQLRLLYTTRDEHASAVNTAIRSREVSTRYNDPLRVIVERIPSVRANVLRYIYVDEIRCWTGFSEWPNGKEHTARGLVDKYS